MPTVPGQQESAEDFFSRVGKRQEPTPVDGSSVEDFFANIERAKATKVAASMDESARTLLPEMAARVSKIKSRAPFPEDFIVRNYAELEKQVNQPNWDYQKFIKSSPTVSDYIIDSPAFAGLHPDAIRAMGNIEDLLRRPKILWPKSPKQMEAEADELAGLMEQGGRAATMGSAAFPQGFLVPNMESNADAKERFRREALQQIQEDEAFVQSESEVGAGEAYSRRTRQNPAWWAPYAAGALDAGSALELYGLAKKVESEQASPAEKAKFARISRVQAAEEYRGYSVSARATEILMGLPAFGGEMLSSGPLAKGVGGAVTGLAKGAVEATFQNAFAKGLGYGVGKLAQAAGPMAAHSLESAARRATPQATARTEGANVQFDFVEGEPWSVAIPKGIVDTWIEVVSEDAGGLLKWMDAPVNKILYNAWTPKAATKTAKAFQETMAKAGIHGLLSEMGEEQVGAIMRHIAGLEEYKLPTGEELAAQALAFSVPGAVGAAANRIGRRTEPDATNPEFFKAIGDYAKKAIESTNAPEVVEATVKAAASAAGVRTVYAPLEAWHDYKWEDAAGKPISPKQAYINVVGNSEAYDKAVAEGTDIPIPVQRYAVTLAADEKANTYWQEELRITPEEENKREAEERVEREEKASKQEEGENVPLPESLSEDRSGLTGDKFSKLADKQAQDAKALADSLEDGLYTLTNEDGSTRNIRIQSNKSGTARNVYDEESGDAINLASTMLPSRNEDGTYEKAPTLSRKKGGKGEVAVQGEAIDLKEVGMGEESDSPVPPAVGGLPKPSILTRVKNAIFGKSEDEADPVEADIERQLMGVGNTRPEAKAKAKQFGKVFSNLSRLGKVDKQELFRKFRPTIQKVGKARQNAFQSPKKGGYVPGEGEGTPFIELTRNADPTTFLHESAHLYLDMLSFLAGKENVDPKLAKLWQDTLNWFGVTAEEWSEMSFEQRRPLHEKFAKGFEAYLFDGKAPSKSLKAVFYQFAAWLRNIYRSVRALGVELTPEVRSIYDRLLASDEEIQAAKERAGLNAEDPKALGLTPKQAEEIDALDREADQAAHEAIVSKAMVKFTREEFKRRDNLRSALRAGVEKEFNENPAFRALTVLQTGKEPAGGAVAPELKGLTISRELAEQVAGRETVDALPSTMFSKEGVHPDVAARLLGFGAGADLLSQMAQMQQIGSTPEREKAIRQELERLDEMERDLIASVSALKSEEKEVTKEVAAGREKIAKRLERAMKASERASISGLSEILKGIRDRGGIIPSKETKRIPARYLATGDRGILSDVLAQEMADRGVLKDADSDTLYDWLGEKLDALAHVKDRLKEIPEEAKKIAAQQVGNLPQVIIDNAERRKELAASLKQATTEKSRLEKRSFENWREDLINSQVEARAERNGLNIGSITEAERDQMERDATAAVHDEKHDQVLRKKFEYFVENKRPELKAVLKTLTKRVSPEKVRQVAEDRIRKTVATEIKPGMFSRAAERASREKITAFTKGDIQGAFEAFEREIVNRAMYREALKAEDRIDSIRAYLGRFDEHDVRAELGKAGGDYLEQIDALMERISFNYASRAQVEKRRSLREFAEEHSEDFEVVIPERVLDEANRKSYREMTLEELDEIRDVVKNIVKLSDLKNHLIKSEKRRRLESIEDEIRESIVAHAPKKLEAKIETRLPGDNLAHKMRAALASHEKFAMIARQLDGFKQGPMWEHIVRPINEAADKKVEKNVEIAKKLEALEKRFSTEERIRMGKLEPVKELGGAKLTRWGRISMALNSGNTDNLAKNAAGLSVTLERHVTMQEVLAVRETLTEKELDYVQDVLDLFESFKGEVGELEKQANGLEPKWVEPTPWTSKYGKDYRGGYFPLRYDNRQDSHKTSEADSKRIMEGNFLMASTNHAHRINRVKGVHRPLLHDHSVIYSAFDELIHDLTHYVAVTDVDRILRRKDVERSIKRHYGPEVYDELRRAVIDVAAGDKPSRDAGEDAARFIRRGSVISMMAWNIVSALQQPTGISLAVPRLGLKAISEGFRSWTNSAGEIEGTAAWIMEQSSFMKNRLGGITMTRELNEVRAALASKGDTQLKIDRAVEAVTGGKLDSQDIQDSMYYFQVKMQGFADIVIWRASYKKSMAEQAGKDVPHDEAHDRAVATADQDVIDTQGSGMTKDRARVERGQGWMQLWTALYSYMSVTLGQNLEAVRKLNFKKPESIGRYLADFLFINTVPILGSMAVFAGLRGDEDEDEGFLEKLAKEHLAYLAGQFIILREAQGFLKGRGNYEGPAGASTIANIYRLVAQAGQLLDSDSKQYMDFTDPALLRSLNRTGGTILQYPANQIDRTVRGVRALLEGESSNPLAPLVGPALKR